MNKNKWFFQLLKYLSLLLIAFFAAMFYWSSLLVEKKVQTLSLEIKNIKEDLKNVERRSRQMGVTKKIEEQEKAAGKYIDTKYPNLLQPDPFYTTTLPKLLGSNFVPYGQFKNATYGRPDKINPFSGWMQVNEWISLCNGTPATLLFGRYNTFAEKFAIKMEERINEKTKIPEYWVHLRDDLFWQPLEQKFFPAGFQLNPWFTQKHPVTAHDFKFYFDAAMNPFNQLAGALTARVYYSDLESIEVIDDWTFIVRWKAKEFTDAKGNKIKKIKYTAKQLTGSLFPLASFVYKFFPDGKKIIDDDTDQNSYRTNSVWAQNFSQHWAKNIIASCGPWSFAGFSDEQIAFQRNEGFYTQLDALAEGINIQFKESPEGVWQAFKANQTDSIEIPPDQIIELNDFLASPQYKEQENGGNKINRLDFFQRTYNYIGWNQAKPFFKSRKIRQALTMAIDRERIVQQTLNGMGRVIHGSFFIDDKASNPNIKPWPFDPQLAKRLLQEEGWFETGSGTLEKTIDGKKTPFSFKLTYYVKNQTSKAVCEYVSTALKEVGILCELNGVDVADLSATFEDKSFDALYLAWSLGTPPEDPKQLWHSSGAKEKGSSNSVGFINAEADAIIEQLQYEDNEEKRTKLYHRFDQIIHEEQPYTFLFTPKTAFVYREYLKNVFIPTDRKDLIPGADIESPQSSIFYLRKLE